MKKTILYILTVAAICVFISDRLLAQERRTYNFKDFEEVSVGGGMNVHITQASSYSIEIEADKDDLELIEVEQRGNGLRIYVDKYSYRRMNDVNVRIKMPVLTALGLSGGSEGKLSMNSGSKRFDLDLSGGAELEGELTCGNIEINSSGGSIVKLTGKAGNLRTSGSGGSVFKLKGFTVKDVDADLSGGSYVTVTMDGTLDSDQSGGSKIVYYGNAKLGSNDFSGGSGISRGD